MSSFQEVVIGDVCAVGDGAHSKVERVDTGVPYLTSKNIGQGVLKLDKLDFISKGSFEKLFPKNSKATRRPQQGDVLFGIIGTFGNTYLYKEGDDFGFSSSIGILRPDPDQLDSEYLYYVLSSRAFKSNHANHNAGSVQGYTNISTVKSLPLPLPQLDAQKKIAKVLKSLDKKIELNRKTNQTLEQIAQAIFKSWFVDFEPTRAKLKAKQAGQDPERAAMAAISGKTPDELDQLTQEQLEQLKTTAALFPDSLFDSALGEIPEGWEVKPLSSWGGIVCGKTPPKKNEENYGGHIPFIKIPDMHGNMYVISTVDTLTEQGAGTQKKKILPKGSVCVSCIATVGQVVITSEVGCTNQQINSIIPIEIKHSPYLYFSMIGLYDYLHDLASGGSATLNLNTGNFSKIEIKKPSSEVLLGFAKIVEPMMEGILANCLQKKLLSSTRDTLLPKLLSGELSTELTEAGKQ